MVRLPRFWTFMAAVVLTGACGSESLHPTPIPVTPTPVISSSSTRTLKGVVVDEGDRPVPGAEVRFTESLSPAPLITDATGAFELTLAPGTQIANAASVTVEKPGYEPTSGWAGNPCCERIRLYQIREIAAGDTVTLTLFNDAYCGQFLDFPCRRVRMRSSSAGRLTVRVTPDEFGVLLEDGSPWQMPPSSLSTQVKAGSVTAVDVWAPGSWDGQGTGRGFTLTSSVQ